MNWQDRIEKVPGILSGKPVIKGTRISVEQIVGHLNGAWTEDDVIAGYHITPEDVEACRRFAATGEPLSPMTWAEWEAAVFGDEEQLRQQIVFYCERHRNKTMPPEDWRKRIEKCPDILSGKPVVKGTRISVELIVGHLYGGWTEDDIIQSYSHITPEDIEACRQFAATGERLSPVTWAEWEAALFDGAQLVPENSHNQHES